MQYLLEHGANIEADDDDSNTGMQNYFYSGLEYGRYDVRIFDLLVAEGADLDRVFDDDYSYLHHAAKQGNVVVYDRLLLAGIDSSTLNIEDATGLDLLLETMNNDVVAEWLGLETDERLNIEREIIDALLVI